MTSMHQTRPLQIILAAAFLSACGGTTPPPQVDIAPEPDPVAVAEEAAEAREAEPPLEVRWRAPFAVSSVGRTIPREPRDVAIIGADPAIAERLDENVRPRDEDAPANVVDVAEPLPDPQVAEREPEPEPEPEPAAAVAETESEPVRYRTVAHEVGAGDTLWGIAREYGVSAEVIRELNDLPGDRVRLGETLRIPVPSEGSASGRGDGADGGGDPISHRVGPGDTLWGIARQYNVSADLIREANDLRDDRVRLGETLRIPRPADDF